MTHVMRAAATVTAGLVLALAGCGGDDGGGDGGEGGGEALSRTELVERANEICSRYAEQGDALQAPEDINDPQQAARFFNEAADLAERQQGELEELQPAEDARTEYEQLVRATGRATSLLGDLAQAAEDEDARQGTELLQRLEPDSRAVDEAAQALGAEACAG